MHGVRVRESERLCALALVKRFCGPAFFSKTLGLSQRDIHYPDTATVAAQDWLRQTDIKSEKSGWNGQWLHWRKPDQEEDAVPEDIWKDILAQRKERPVPTYYAILAMDGDNMGKWLRGDNSPRMADVYHPQIREYFEKLDSQAAPGLAARRPVGPAMHAAISEALANFALHVAPEIVASHSGTLIYSGGDDVLALLPTSTALACAQELAKAFRGTRANDLPRGHHRLKNGRRRLMMGPTATASTGLAVAHYKTDLRFALEAARSAEKQAKNLGRNSLSIKVCRRSGEHSSALCPWEFVPVVENMVKAFLDGASDRFAYHLAAEAPTLRGLELDAICAEVSRQLQRSEAETRRLVSGQDEPLKAGQFLAEKFRAYHGLVSSAERGLDTGSALTGFTTLCQSASFLARGRDA